jgi:hypothetical protein
MMLFATGAAAAVLLIAATDRPFIGEISVSPNNKVWQFIIEAFNRCPLLERCEAGASCVSVTRRKWRRSKGHETVAHILVDETVTVTYRAGHSGEVVV